MLDTRLYIVLFALFASQVHGGILNNGDKPAIIEDIRSASKSSISRVTGGWPAVDYQIPYQINLRMVNTLGTVSACGGSIIHHEWILTAAHCVANRVSFVVRLGLTNVTRPDYIVETQQYYIHPQYIEAIAGVQTDDIALMKLDQHIPYTRSIQPSRLQNRLQTTNPLVGTVLTVSGYGLTSDGGSTSEVLNYVYLRVITNVECRAWYMGSTIIQDVTICTESFNQTGQSSCSGDSGGPVTFIDLDGKPTQVGVVSFGSSSGCETGFPSAHVRPGFYHDWFTEVTGLSFDWVDYEQEDTSTDPPQTTTETVGDVGVVTLPTTTVADDDNIGDGEDGDFSGDSEIIDNEEAVNDESADNDIEAALKNDELIILSLLT